MKLYTKPSELYTDLKKDSDFLQLFVGSKTIAENIIDLSLRSDDELSENATRESALVEQSAFIAHEIFTNFQKHVKNIKFHDLASSQHVTFQTMSDLVDNFESVVDYVSSDPQQFVANFAKDPRELDKEYCIQKFGAKKEVNVKYSSYGDLDYLRNNEISRSCSLPEEFYIADRKLYRFNSDESSMKQIIHGGQPIVPHLFFASPQGDKNAIEYVIDKKRGIFGFTKAGVVPILENKFSKIIGNRYVIFERKENNDKVINLVVDMYNPQNPVTLPLPSGYPFFVIEEKGKIHDVSIAFETLPLKSTFLFSGGESLDVRNILRDQYRDFSLIITSEEDRFFIVRAEKDSKVYDYHIIFTDGTSSLITTVGEGIKLINDGGYGYTHETYDSETKKLSIEFSPEYDFLNTIFNGIKGYGNTSGNRKREKEEVSINLELKLR